MKRSGVDLEAIADWHNLAAAFHRAALGKQRRPEVLAFRDHLDEELSRLRREILEGSVAVGQMRCFHIRDPKPRIIHAPCFRERVLHHALMAHVGPVLDRALVDDTYACRTGKGALAAVQRAQHHARRWPWFAKIDIRAYFASIDHAVLLNRLERRFKNRSLLELLARIIASHQSAPGKGLPIGALTSQQFANYYLSGLDRFLLEDCQVAGLVRYMDDLVWWGADRDSVRSTLSRAMVFAADQLKLTVKRPTLTGRSTLGLPFCGYRVFPGQLLLSRRRKHRYAAVRRQWERAYLAGDLTLDALQAGFASALGITAHADASAWRRMQLSRNPVAEALAAL